MEFFRKFKLFSTAGLTVMLVVGLILGLAAGLLIPRGSTPGDHSPEAGFARDMSSHHAQAVAMGMIAYQRASNYAVQQMGMDIALTQQGQIGVMDEWLHKWNLGANSPDAPMAWMPDGQAAIAENGGLMPGMATEQEMAALEAARGIEVDRLFLKMMIKHHLGGIHMVDGVLKISDNADVVGLAGGMKRAQQGEIQAMQLLQKSVGDG